MKKIIFESHKLKHPNTGLYHFTLELGRALKELQPKGYELKFFVRIQDYKLIGRRDECVPIRAWSKLCLAPTASTVLWHSPYQLSPFIPRSKSIKVVVTVHDLNFLYEKNEKKQAARIAKLQKNIDRASAVVAISEYSKADLLRHIDLRGKPVEVIYNGCNVYTGTVSEPKEKPQTPFLFGVGTILRKKNWHVLPSLLVGNEMSLYIAGTPSAYSEVIMEQARTVGVSDRVHLTGEVSEAEKHWYLANCTAFVFPSIAEGFGLPVIEAMYYGKPVFLSSHTSLPEVGGDFAYYFPADFAADGMRKVFESGMADFASNGRIEAQRAHAMSFSWQKAAQEYWHLYRSLDRE